MIEPEDPYNFNTIYIVPRLSEYDLNKTIKRAINFQFKHM